MFILLAQNEPKGQPITCPPKANALRCSQRTGDVGKSLSLRRVAYPPFVALLGCVKWPIKYFSTVNNAKPFYGWMLNFAVISYFQINIDVYENDLPTREFLRRTQVF
jgi:hypothetical protein